MPYDRAARAVDAQRRHFATGVTLETAYRVKALLRLKRLLEDHEKEFHRRLQADLGKAPVEALMSETGPVVKEIAHAVSRVRAWSRPRRVRTPLALFAARSYVAPEPLGVTLIIGPWNYPLQLILAPLIPALAAGNCAVLKPSELAPATSALIAQLIGEHFDPGFVAVLEGGVETAQALLEQRFDHIFFTGGTQVGKIVAQAAAKTLTPVTLELGGKSPCIVDASIDVKVAARRIAWGKFFNAGQTCIAPDYLLVDRRIKQELLNAMKEAVTAFYGSEPLRSPDYGRIVNQAHFDRLTALLKRGRIAFGGETDPARLSIAPTVLEPDSPDDPVMESEIFGPILPVLEFTEVTQALSFVNHRPKPLALYVFSRNSRFVDRVLSQTTSGGATVNDTLLHVSVTSLPFGGVGDSGIGRYHGRFGFDTFSNLRSVTRKSFFPDPPFRYPPFRGKFGIVKRLLKYFG